MPITSDIATRIQKRLQANGEPEADFLFSKAHNGDALFVIDALRNTSVELDAALMSDKRVEFRSKGKPIATFFHDFGPSLLADCQSAKRVNVLEMDGETPIKSHLITPGPVST